MHTLTELTLNKNLGWQDIQSWLTTATNIVELLSKNSYQAEQALLATQVTTNSPIGAIIFHTGGIKVNYGWLRILGSGSPQVIRRIDTWNASISPHQFFLVADDVVGGYFAINGGGLSESEEHIGNIFYFAPDTLEWENLGVGYSGFIQWAFSGDLDQFYQNFYWQNWQLDIKTMSADDVFSFYPFLWTAEGKDINNVSKKAVPILEDFLFKQSL